MAAIMILLATATLAMACFLVPEAENSRDGLLIMAVYFLCLAIWLKQDEHK